MRVRSHTLDDVTRMLVNRNNPKTMDYYFFRIMQIAPSIIGVNYEGVYDLKLASRNAEVSAGMTLCQKRRGGKYKSIFTIPMFPDHKFPKSRSLKILSTSSNYIALINPKRGTTEEITTAGGFKFYRAQPDYLQQPKNHVCYAHGKWERRGQLKTSIEID